MSSILDRASFIWGGAPDYKVGYSWALKPRNGDGIVPTVRASDKWVLNDAGVLVKRSANEIGNEWDADGNYLGTLIQPISNNQLLYSNDLSQSWWVKSGAIIQSRNVIIDGNFADSITQDTASSTFHRAISTAVIVTASTQYSFEVKAKVKTGTDILVINIETNGTNYASFGFDLINGTTHAGFTVGYSGTTASIKDEGNGVYRCRITSTISAFTSASCSIAFSESTSWTNIGRGLPAFTGDGTSAFYIYDVQFKAGAGDEVMVKTNGEAVNGQADVLSKTNVAHLIGQSEGTIYVECKKTALPVTGQFSRVFAVGGGTVNNRVIIIETDNGSLAATITKGGPGIGYTSSTLLSTISRIALRYTSTDIALFADGVKLGEVSFTGTLSTPLSNMYFGKEETSNNTRHLNGHIALVALFKEALTDTEIANIPPIVYTV